MIKKNDYYIFENLSQFPQIIHGVSTKKFGSVKRTDPQKEEHIKKLAGALHFNPGKIVVGMQVHSGNVLHIDSSTQHDPEDTDGLITGEHDLYAGVVTADCVPLLLFDPQKNIIATVHAGFKGIQNKIINNMIAKFEALGSQPENIVAGIGPAIGVCCYNVTKERIDMFSELFPLYKDFYQERNSTYYLDINQLVKYNLLDAGVRDRNIEMSSLCTVDHVDEFYSYRKEGEASGRFMSIIGLKS